MLHYPSILGSAKAPLGKPCVAFYKYDGSNLRFEWTTKSGWSKFGTRRQLFDAQTPVFGRSIQYFHDTGMADEIVRRTIDYRRKPERIIAFGEWFGPNSFAGLHAETEEQELRLFDITLFKLGFLSPKDFIKVYGDMPQAAEIVYEGNMNKQFINDVKTGKYNVFEGVVAKGNDWSVKIKTDAYFEKLRNKFPERWQEYGE
jgi:hypothetical protein